MSDFKEKWRKMPKVVRVMGYIFLGIFAILGMGFVFGYVVQLLWNWLMPEIFGFKEITYLQGIGIFVLAKLLFGSFGGGSGDSKSQKKEDLSHSKQCESWEDYDEWWDKKGKNDFEKYSETKNETDKNEDCGGR